MLEPRNVSHADDRRTAPRDPVGVGSVLKGRFVLESAIAHGGMGVVYKALDLRRQEARDREPYVAIKVLNEEFRRHRDSFVALQRECKKTQKLAHPNIVTVFDFDRDGTTIFMTMELLEGESLEQLLRRTRPNPLPKDKALALVRGIGHGLAYAHAQNIVHSDFKPGNVFITKDNVVKVLDFGIARAAKRPNQAQQEMTVFDAGVLGALTPPYASYEMFANQEPDPRDDVYALACVTYELLAGHHPFHRATATQARARKLRPALIKGTTRRQWHGLLHGLAFRRAERTPSVNDFLQEIAAVERTNASARTGAWALGLSVVGVVLLVAASFAFLALTPAPSNDELIESAWTRSVPFEALSETTRVKIETLLEVGEAHFFVGRLTEPPGSSAYDAYQQVLELHPGNERALSGFQSIADKYEELARKSCEDHNSEECLMLIQSGLKVMPDHKALRALQREVKTKVKVNT